MMKSLIYFESLLMLFAIVNPIGSIPIFLQLTSGMSRIDRRRTFYTAVAVGLPILLLFAFAGEQLMGLFRLEMKHLMAAGGLLLLVIAIDHLIFGFLVRSVSVKSASNPYEIGAVPIACPILAGPGAMVTTMIIFKNYGSLVASFSVIAVFLCTGLIMIFLEPLHRFLGKIVCTVLSKVLCLFLAAIGIRLLMQALNL